ncbi:kininogen-1 [Paroedura picta]|uniref:kininogen-1 n=1 Tax=Paroedura picta TaxID=143630 RepID=UPI004056DA45
MRNECPLCFSAPYLPLERQQGVLSLPAKRKKNLRILKSPFSSFARFRFHKEPLCPAMEFVFLLALSFCFCQATPPLTQEVDCDDPSVFNAVDLALQKFNGERSFGHQFALAVITHAKKTAGPGTGVFFDVKYHLRETVCSIGEGIPWQKCDFREPLEAESGKCKAQIYVDDLLHFSNVSQKCHLVPAEGQVTASRAPCTGCWAPISTNSLQLLPLVRHTIRRYNNENNHPSLFEVLEIKRAQSQVVAGWNYAFEYLIKETNCSRAGFPELTPACKRMPGGREGKCIAFAHINITNGLSFAVQECTLLAREAASRAHRCPGCPRPLPTNSTQLEGPLRAALEKYNLESNSDAYYKIDTILDASSQVVAGTKYQVEFIVVKTNCSKAEHQELNEDCSPKEKGERQHCIASIYVIPWQSKIFPNVTCEAYVRRALGFVAWPPGMTPFRSLQLAKISSAEESEDTAQKQEGHLHGSRMGLGSARPPGSSPKPEEAQTKEKSSAESHEGVGKPEGKPVARILKVRRFLEKPCQDEANTDGAGCPAMASQQDNPGGTSEFSVFDLLPGPNVPNCPGKPWKPITGDAELGLGFDKEDNRATLPPDTLDFDLAHGLPEHSSFGAEGQQ